MSDILIKNMKMPKTCQQCPLYLQSMDSERNVYEGCAVTQNQYNWGLPYRPSDCPLVEVPQHGDLIDRGALLASENQHYEIHSDSFYVETRTIELAPTIIEAEEMNG